MALPRNGAHSIDVEGARYQWIASAPDAPLCLDIWVQSSAGEGQKLHARVPWGEPCGHQTESVTPRLVALLVREALALGWTPSARGPDFKHWKR